MKSGETLFCRRLGLDSVWGFCLHVLMEIECLELIQEVRPKNRTNQAGECRGERLENLLEICSVAVEQRGAMFFFLVPRGGSSPDTGVSGP